MAGEYDMSGWTFEQMPDDQWSQLMSPSFEPIDLSTGFQNNVDYTPMLNPFTSGGMGAGTSAPALPSGMGIMSPGQTPNFQPSMAPAPGGPAPASISAPTSQPSPTMGGTATYGQGTTAQAPASTPGRGGLGAAAQAPKPSGGFDWQGLFKAAAGPAVTGLLGLGASAIGGSMNKSPRPQQQPAPGAASPAPLPPPTTPTGAPNTGPETAPLPGAQWSPLLSSNPMTQMGKNVGLDVQKRMRRGGQTGGFALY